MGALDSVAVSVGSAPPSITTQPVGDTALSVGDRPELTIVVTAGSGQAIESYTLYRSGTVVSVIETSALTATFAIESFKERDEGEYWIKVTQANNAYKDSGKVFLHLLRLDEDGQYKPFHVNMDLMFLRWVRVDGWTWTYESGFYASLWGNEYFPPGSADSPSAREQHFKLLAYEKYPDGPGSAWTWVLEPFANLHYTGDKSTVAIGEKPEDSVVGGGGGGG